PSPSLIKPGTAPRRVKQGGSKKSFGINNWHSLGKGGKSCDKRKKREKILGLLSGGEGRVFLAKDVAKIYGRQAAGKKEVWRSFFKTGCQVFLFKEVVLGHPCIPRVRVSTGW
ncbi:MAG: hypothetical protein ACK55Z_04530, partial [bacterium]